MALFILIYLGIIDSGNDRLARLFAPPDKIMFRGNFDQVKIQY